MMEGSGSYLFMIVAMVAVMYFLMIRPENRRKKQAQEMRDNLKKGDVITSIGGIVGKIVHVTPNTIIIETSEDRVRMELARWAVSSLGVQSSEQVETAGGGKKTKTEAVEKKDEPVQLEKKAEPATDGAPAAEEEQK